ncbi:MAG: hypothetical protein WC796_04695 [Candidatus Pacearchaeota archaeon]|jgi:hypothetical protein
MIAYLGEIMFASGVKVKPNSKEFDELDINAKQRTDQVNVSWK